MGLHLRRLHLSLHLSKTLGYNSCGGLCTCQARLKEADEMIWSCRSGDCDVLSWGIWRDSTFVGEMNNVSILH